MARNERARSDKLATRSVSDERLFRLPMGYGCGGNFLQLICRHEPVLYTCEVSPCRPYPWSTTRNNLPLLPSMYVPAVGVVGLPVSSLPYTTELELLSVILK